MLVFGFRVIDCLVEADRLEHDVQVARGSEGGEKWGHVGETGAQVVKDRALSFEQRFDVDQVNRPCAAFENLRAFREAAVSLSLSASGFLNVFQGGWAKDSRGGGYAGQLRSLVAAFNQNLTELDSSMRPDDDEIPTGEGGFGAGTESADLARRSVTDQV